MGPNNVNYSDGNFTNLTDFTKINPQLNPPLNTGDIVQLYAVKHNPFAYFRACQEGHNPMFSSRPDALHSTVGTACGPICAPGTCRTFSFIAPNQCNDQHGRGNGTALLRLRSRWTTARQAGLNPALIHARRSGRARRSSTPSTPRRHGSTDTTRSSWFGTRTTTPCSRSSTRSSPSWTRTTASTNYRAAVLHPLLAAADDRRRLRSALPEPRLRREHHVRPLRRRGLVSGSSIRNAAVHRDRSRRPVPICFLVGESPSTLHSEAASVLYTGEFDGRNRQTLPKPATRRAQLDSTTRDSGLATQDYLGYQSSTRTSIPVPSSAF